MRIDYKTRAALMTDEQLLAELLRVREAGRRLDVEIAVHRAELARRARVAQDAGRQVTS